MFVWRGTDLYSGFIRREKWSVVYLGTAMLGNNVEGRMSAHSAKVLKSISIGWASGLQKDGYRWFRKIL